MASYRSFLFIVFTIGCIPHALALSLNGVTDFATVLELNAATRGVIRSVEVKPGQRVARGDVLLRIDDTRHQAQVNKTAAIAKALLPDVTIAQLELERAEELYALDSLSQVDLQNAENKLARAEGAYQAALAESEQAVYDLQHTVVQAPFDGRVLSLQVHESNYVDPSVELSPLVTLADSRNMLAIASLSAKLWNPSLLNKGAIIIAGGREYSGRVSRLALRPDAAAPAKPQYGIQISFETGNPLPAGMPVSIEIKE